MVDEKLAENFGLNESYVEILRAQWQENPLSIAKEWREFFEKNLKTLKKPSVDETKALNLSTTAKKIDPSNDVKTSRMVGIEHKIAQNMQESLSVPIATSTRFIPVKVLEENRLVINQFLDFDGRLRCSYTHLIAFALIKALKKYSNLNNAFVWQDNLPIKLLRKHINFGIAVDVLSKDGAHSLVVPNIKHAQDLNFWQFFHCYNQLIEKAKNNRLEPNDFMDTTVTLTNPGGLGTVLSNPRLMVNQGSIFATGTIGFPAEYESVAPETIQMLGIGKVMGVTSTYDHRIIQGAQSGSFLSYLHELLVGRAGFFEEIFLSLKIPYSPYKITKDQAAILGAHGSFTQTKRAMRVSELINAYRENGFLIANVDPLDLQCKKYPELDLEAYGLTIWDLDREFDTLGLLTKDTASFREIIDHLRKIYCRRMGIEYMHITDEQRRIWLQKRIERNEENFTLQHKKRILEDLAQAEGFEHFLHKRFVGHKRFSVEGAESVIPLLRELLDKAAQDNATEAIIGMAHRGRLNILANIVGKPYEAIFAEFDDIDPKTIQGSGDVKYHLGAKGIHHYHGFVKGVDRQESRDLRVELACNPSHLEAVNPIVEGIVRAKQDLVGDENCEKIIPILIHGDAAFAAQGIAYETLQLSGLEGFKTGGTIHIIINNQIGYTTPKEKARTSLNCSDLGRALGIPVFRVNGDCPEDCLKAAKMAFDFRSHFKSDVIIDMVCYRRHGHNEGDEPSFTQPILYRAIKEHPSVARIYADLLIRRKDITEEEVGQIEQKFHDSFEMALARVREKGFNAVGKEHVLEEFDAITENLEEPITKTSIDILKQITQKTTFEPETIEIHPRIKEHVLEKRLSMVNDEKSKIDFGAAEILAYGTLLLEGIPVRISGQDCGRGTFAHRHAVLYDINDGRAYIPLNHLQGLKGETQDLQPSRFRIYDSPLSEEAVLGFEYGYSVSHPSSLVIWEAQFGDFFNGAQIQIDQFIASSEAKWGQKSRLVLMLPHGYDGQGPEHSSARIERFLQLSAQNNLRVCNCTTPSQMFHLLRRQAKLKKKPLIIFTHKSLLRAEDAASPISDLCEGKFNKVLSDPLEEEKKSIDRLIFLSGKVYWDLKRYKDQLVDPKICIRLIRIEELYPFPKEEIINIISESRASELVWLQEEPRNSGAFLYMKDRFDRLNLLLNYIGRKENPSPATGSARVHKFEQASILEAAFRPMERPVKSVEI